MRIYTKTGDDGTTGLFSGSRVLKNDPRIDAFGGVDELNAVLGMVCAAASESEQVTNAQDSELFARMIRAIQHDLFAIGAELATPNPEAHGTRIIGSEHVGQLERWIDLYDARMPGLKNFILPGGTLLAANLHWARTVCRRVERGVVNLMQQADASDYKTVLIYLNRLGDLLFVLARFANFHAGTHDVRWDKNRALDAEGIV